MTLGDRIKRPAHSVGLNRGLAGHAQVRRETIFAELETNRRVTVSSEILRRLAKALGCTTDYLVGMYADDDEELAKSVPWWLRSRCRTKHRNNSTRSTKP